MPARVGGSHRRRLPAWQDELQSVAGPPTVAPRRAEPVEDVLGGALEIGQSTRRESPSRRSRSTLRGLPSGVPYDGVGGRLDVLRQPIRKAERERRRWRAALAKLTRASSRPAPLRMPGWIPPRAPAVPRASCSPIAGLGERAVARRPQRRLPPVRPDATRTRGPAEVLRAIVEISLGTRRSASATRRCAAATPAAHPPDAGAAAGGSRSGSRASPAARSARRRGRTATNRVVDQDRHRTASADQLRPLPPIVLVPEWQPIDADIPELIRPVPDAEVRITDRAAQVRLDRQRIGLIAEQPSHLGEVASNRNPVRGDEKDGNDHSQTGDRLGHERRAISNVSARLYARRQETAPVRAAMATNEHRPTAARSPGGRRRSPVRTPRPTKPAMPTQALSTRRGSRPAPGSPPGPRGCVRRTGRSGGRASARRPRLEPHPSGRYRGRHGHRQDRLRGRQAVGPRDLEHEPWDKQRGDQQSERGERIGPGHAGHPPGHARPGQGGQGGCNAAEGSPTKPCATAAASKVRGTSRPAQPARGLCPRRPEAQSHNDKDDRGDEDRWTTSKRA